MAFIASLSIHFRLLEACPRPHHTKYTHVHHAIMTYQGRSSVDLPLPPQQQDSMVFPQITLFLVRQLGSRLAPRRDHDRVGCWNRNFWPSRRGDPDCGAAQNVSQGLVYGLCWFSICGAVLALMVHLSAMHLLQIAQVLRDEPSLFLHVGISCVHSVQHARIYQWV